MNYKNITDFFPPPQFLDIEYTGISLSDNYVRCVRFSKKNKNIALDAYAERPIPAGVITSGIINNNEELAKILISLRDELHIEYARISLPEERTYLFTSAIPVVSKKDIRSTIGFKIEENVPVPSADIAFDYIVTNPHTYTQTLSVTVSACPISIIQMYTDIVLKSGIKPLSLEIKSQSIARAVLPKGNLGTYIVVYFNLDKIGAYVISNGVACFTSTISSEGESLEPPHFLTVELKKINAYWNNHTENEDNEDRSIKQIIVCGEGFDESILDYLSANQDIPVVWANVWSNVYDISSQVPQIPFMDSLKYVSAIGLALPTDILI